MNLDVYQADATPIYRFLRLRCFATLRLAIASG
jgi:hypothetical protein